MKRQKLAIDGARPIRTKPLPLEFLGAHYMDYREVRAVARVMRAHSPFRYYRLDPRKEMEVDQFEIEFARFVGVKHALGVASGTGALHVALSALGVGPGQEVIVPAYLWVAVLAAIVNHGAIPVLADINSTFGIDPVALRKRITEKTKGIIAIHMSGAPCDIKSIAKVAREHELWLLEDCAQCNGGTVHKRKVGSFGDMGIFSFQMNKNMTAGEGGCVVTSDDQLFRRAFACHDLGYARDENGRLILADPTLRLWGRGYRLDDLRGAVLRVQLKKLPAIVGHMRKSKYRIRRALERYPAVLLRKIADPAGDTGAFLITTYPDAMAAKRVNQALRAEGIVTAPQGISNIVMTEWGLHLYYNNSSLVHRSSVDGHGFPWTLGDNSNLGGDYQKGTCPCADSLFERSILLPIPSCLTKRDEDDIIHAFQKVLDALLP